jgi:2-hydroxymuconate-semialdehyde hydrolase
LIRALALACALTLGCSAWQRPGEPLGARLGPDARYVHARDGRAIYTELRGPTEGPATPVLLVHGFASNHDVWDPLEPALREGRRTINVDLPGFGWSARTEGDYSPQALAEVLIDVMDAAGVQRADVVAHSWGSSVTLALALAHPERVRRITLIGAWIYDEQIPPFFRWARVPGVGETLFSAFYTERPADRFPDAFDDPSLVSQELVEAIEQSLSRPGTSRAALAAARGQCFLQMERRYRTIAHRTLLVWGEDDHVARLRFGERLSQEMPDARLAPLPRTGHFPMLESAAATRRLVREFLDAPDPVAPQSVATSDGGAP